MEAFVRRARDWFGYVSVYRAMDHLLDPELLPEMGEDQFVVVCASSGDPSWRLTLPGFEALPAAEG
jgi:phosphopentomutase